MEALFTKDTFKKQSVDFRIGAIISDGMWYTVQKWRKLAKVNEEEINEWIETNLKNGSLIQSETGKSYRFSLESINRWYTKYSLPRDEQLVDFLFPPRIWDNQTETEGFLAAPLREIGVVSFNGDSAIAEEVAQALRGVARVREAEPGKYKAYCLNAFYVKGIIEPIVKKYPGKTENGKTYSRSEAKRREIVDFTPSFSDGLVKFYKVFGKSLVKREMETIKIYLPDPDDQDSQITIWVLTAIEKFDESSAVPFSGYLNSVLKRWPYDLPTQHLGKDLSAFQRQRSRAIESLKQRHGEEKNFTNIELANAMELDQRSFNDLEEKHRVWTKARSATTLNWSESADEKLVESNISGDYSNSGSDSDIDLANKLSISVIQTAIQTGLYNDALRLIAQIDSSEIDTQMVKSVSDDFIKTLGSIMGLER